MIRIIFLMFLFLITKSINAQKGDTVLYFKNGDTISGYGRLKGAEFIKFKKDKKGGYKTISFNNLNKADVKIKDTIISYKLFPITKKNGKAKTPSVIGLFESGSVNLYVKGDIKRIAYFTQQLGGTGLTFGGTTDSIIHYFLRKETEPKAVHIGSSYFGNEHLLKSTENIFSECPDLLENILKESSVDTSIYEIIEKYNTSCKQLTNNAEK
ncbi:hypothetical protein JBL43_18995 [Aureibaculum sp. A20]|uniref:DUF4369 domain-containing protein n=1 Tax=Aureibaculum flavum TaxID=2795986 RepID=A0ABS0WWM4_9FLAO|nr:hypothetical protein [Aureibaculum flavum]MBJ2176347.1 hypothetical protein [Aureibaculum flavum]